MKTHWELSSNGRTSVLDVNESEVCVGSTCGPAGSMVGNVVSHAEFLEGRYHEVSPWTHAHIHLAASCSGARAASSAIIRSAPMNSLNSGKENICSRMLSVLPSARMVE